MDKQQNLESPYWLEMVQYFTELAKVNTSLDGVNRALMNKEPKIGRGFQDYKRVLQTLTDEKVLLINDSKLILGSIKNSTWINAGLDKGFDKIWELAYAIESSNKWEGKYDNTKLNEIGMRGEEAVISFLHKNIDERYHKKIKHVSKTDDYAGYDIFSPSVLNHENSVLLEIKTTVKPSSNFVFYLSRNEYKKAMVRDNWVLAFVRIKNDMPQIVGHLKIDQIEQFFPRDSLIASWDSLKVKISEKILQKGMP